MLYSLTCRIAGELFDDKALRAKAESLKEKITKQSFDGELFVDNAIRDENGVLAPTGNHSEICQYFAYFCKIAEPNDDRYKSLIDTIVNVFGSEREEKGIMPEIVYAQPFIGYYVRMLILLDLHKFRNIIRDIKGYFLNMANTTGTLWEYGSIEKSKGSLNHGFASYAGVALLYAVSGISCIKYDEKKLCIDRSFMYEADYNLKISVPEGSIEIIKKDTVKTVNVPEGWEIV